VFFSIQRNKKCIELVFVKKNCFTNEVGLTGFKKNASYAWLVITFAKRGEFHMGNGIWIILPIFRL